MAKLAAYLTYGTEEDALDDIEGAWEYLRDFMASDDECAAPLEREDCTYQGSMQRYKFRGHPTASAWVYECMRRWGRLDEGPKRTWRIYVLRSRDEAVAALNEKTGEMLLKYRIGDIHDCTLRKHLDWFADYCTELTGARYTFDEDFEEVV